MKTLSVKSKWFSDSDLRIDAAFHLSDGPKSKRQLEKSPYPLTTLEAETSAIYSGGIFKRVLVANPDRGYPYFTGSDMMKSDLNTGKFISKKYTINLDELAVKKGWLLVTRSGTLGNIVFTNEDFEGKVGTDDLIRIIPNDNEVKPGFLYAYLTGKYGNPLLTQASYGGVVKHIEPHHIQELPIPVFPKDKQEDIHKLIVETAELRVEANKMLAKVNMILQLHIGVDEELNKKITSRTEKDIGNIFICKSHDLSTKTLRARNYSLRKNAIIEILSLKKYDRLKVVLEKSPYYGSRYKRIESKNSSGVELLSQGDLFDTKPLGRLISTRSINNFDDEIVRKGTILIPAQGTLGENEIFGRAKFVWGYLENKLAAGHAMRFVPDSSKIPEGYLFAVLSSPYWFRMLRNTVYGTNLLGFIVPLLEELPIPRFDSSIEIQIDNLVKDAYTCLTSANKKEFTAIKIIEDEMDQWQ